MKDIYNPYSEIEGYNCFGCSPKNMAGLRMNFKEDGEEVVSFWDPETKFEGWKNVLHGGIQVTLMDEIASMVVFVKLGTGGVTYKLSTKFRKPVLIDKGRIYLRAKLLEVRKSIAEIEVKLFDGEDKLCSEGSIEYFVMSEEKARKEMHYPGRDAFFK